MEKNKGKAVIEAILFSAGRVIKINELMAIMELSSDEVISLVNSLQEDYQKEDRGIEIIKVEDGYQLATKKKCMSIYILYLIKEVNQAYHKQQWKLYR